MAMDLQSPPRFIFAGFNARWQQNSTAIIVRSLRGYSGTASSPLPPPPSTGRSLTRRASGAVASQWNGRRMILQVARSACSKIEAADSDGGTFSGQLTAALATATPALSAAATSQPLRSPVTQPATRLSPAPVRPTTFEGNAAIWWATSEPGPSRLITAAPFGPRVRTTWRTPAASTAEAAGARDLSSSSAVAWLQSAAAAAGLGVGPGTKTGFRRGVERNRREGEGMHSCRDTQKMRGVGQQATAAHLCNQRPLPWQEAPSD